MINWRSIISRNSKDKTLSSYTQNTQNTQNVVAADNSADIAYIAYEENNSNQSYHAELTVEELNCRAGDDWNEIKNDPNILEAFSKAALYSITRQKGLIPRDYTATTICKNCGEVPIDPSIRNDGYVLGCPWCLNRAKGLPIPKPVQIKKQSGDK